MAGEATHARSAAAKSRSINSPLRFVISRDLSPACAILQPLAGSPPVTTSTHDPAPAPSIVSGPLDSIRRLGICGADSLVADQEVEWIAVLLGGTNESDSVDTIPRALSILGEGLERHDDHLRSRHPSLACLLRPQTARDGSNRRNNHQHFIEKPIWRSYGTHGQCHARPGSLYPANSRRDFEDFSQGASRLARYWRSLRSNHWQRSPAIPHQ